MTALLLFIVASTLLVAGVRSLVDWLNYHRSQSSTRPEEFAAHLSEERFERAKAYLEANTKEDLVERAVSTFLTLAFLLAGGFAYVDELVRGYFAGPVVAGLAYFFVLAILGELTSLLFSYRHTFGTEARFGFNRATRATFVADRLKGYLLGILLGGPILAGLLWFFVSAGPAAWAYAWGFLAVVQLILLVLAPVVLMPLFNRFTPLPEGELKTAIESYAATVRFRLQGIFTMDGSRRSAKANAFFTGLGRFRRIVLFDTLVKQHPVKELVAVLAHEVGHYKRGHIPRMLLASLASSFVLFFLLSLFLNSDWATREAGFSAHSVHAGLTVAFLVYGPLSLLLGLFTQALSRKHEFEADAFAVQTTGGPEPLIEALKRLSVESLSNLDPHPWKVWLEYSHPPVTQRVRAMRGEPARG